MEIRLIYYDIDFVSVRLKRLSWMSGTQSAYRMSVFVAGKWKEYLSTLKIWQAVWWREWTPFQTDITNCLTKMFQVFPHFSSFGLIYARSCQNISLEYDWNYKNRSLGSYLGCCQDIFKIRNTPNPD